MKYLLLLPFLLFACRAEPTNNAKIMAQAQAPDASCDAVHTPSRHIAVAVCTLANKTEVIVITSQTHPFQAFPLKTLESIKAEKAAPPTPPPAEGSGSATPPKK